MDLPQAISTTLGGLDKDAFSSLEVVSPPPDAGTRPGLWMNATISAASSNPPDYMLPKWEAFLAQGAIADRIAGQTPNLADVISGSTIVLQAPDLAEPREVGGGSGDAVAGQIFGAEAAGATDEAITARVQETLKSFGVQSADVRVLHPLGPAVVVTATVPDAAPAKGQFNGLLAAIQGKGEYEGVYLELKNQAGQPLAIVGTADRISAGTQWFADGMDNLLGISHGSTESLSLPSKPAPN